MVIVNHIFTFSFLSEGGSPTRLQSVKWSRGLIDHTRRSCKEIHFTVTNAWQISASWTPSHDLSWKKGQHCTVTQEQKHTSRVASLSWWQEIAREGVQRKTEVATQSHRSNVLGFSSSRLTGTARWELLFLKVPNCLLTQLIVLLNLGRLSKTT